RRDGLLDEDVAAALEKVLGGFSVARGRRRDDDGVRRIGDGVEALEHRQFEFSGDFAGPSAVVVIDADAGNAREIAGDANVVTAKVTDADEGEADGELG